MENAKASLKLLTDKVNEALETHHSETYVSSVRGGRRGSPALRRIVHQIEAEILREAAATAPA